jgi:hypothetical protein
MISRGKNKPVTLKAAFVAALAIATGTSCGPASSAKPAAVVQANQINFPVASGGQAPYTNINGMSQDALNAILGNYGGTVARLDWGGSVTAQQAFTINVSQVQVQFQGQQQQQGQQLPLYAYLRFDSNGPLGNIHFESFLGLGYNGFTQNGVVYYSFASEAKTVSQLSDIPISVELIFGLRNGQFDPAQSAIFIKDCGFSSGVVCSNLASDVTIVNNALGKR